MRKVLCFVLCFSNLIGCAKKEEVVSSITDDIPEINIVDYNMDTTQFNNLSSKKVAWGIGANKDLNGQPVDCVSSNHLYQNYDTYFVGEANHEIYLTFDNGYENGNTSKILDILKEKKVKALFFLTQQYVEENKQLVQRMIDEGHIVGNHTAHHKSFPEISMDEIVDEITEMDAYMIHEFQYKMTMLRPPKGEFTEQSLAICQKLGYVTLFWSVAYYDYDVNHQPDTHSAMKKLMEKVHPGAIYLLHSVSNTNTEILSDFIDELRERNYKMGSFEEFQN